ncbi:peptidase family M28-domain-containing protein [Lipomyces arxii]|uniref:peptidase family M28-domain-containing protein n=1 Tax=Lipomyces arxii TaxID=56418 RepID=UPI0034CDBE8E
MVKAVVTNVLCILVLLILSSLVNALPSQRVQLDETQLLDLFDFHPPFPSLDPNYRSIRTTSDLNSTLKKDGKKETVALLTPMLIPRPPGSHNSTLVQKHITAHFESLKSWTTMVDSFADVVPEYGGVSGLLNFTNLVFRLTPPGSEERPARYLTLVAHYDSKIDPFGFIGAIDSAVPCAILMYLAESLTETVLKRWNSNLVGAAEDIGLQIIFMDGEEALVKWTSQDSLYGARHLANVWENEKRATSRGRLSAIEDIDLFVLLDLLGAKDSSVPCYYGTTSWACRELRAAEDASRAAGIARSNKNKPFVRATDVMNNVMIDDDHMPFLRRGTPVLHLIPVPFPDTWHTMDDDGEHLSSEAVHDWAVFVTAWVAGYLGLGEFI